MIISDSTVVWMSTMLGIKNSKCCHLVGMRYGKTMHRFFFKCTKLAHVSFSFSVTFCIFRKYLSLSGLHSLHFWRFLIVSLPWDFYKVAVVVRLKENWSRREWLVPLGMLYKVQYEPHQSGLSSQWNEILTGWTIPCRKARSEGIACISSTKVLAVCAVPSYAFSPLFLQVLTYLFTVYVKTWLNKTVHFQKRYPQSSIFANIRQGVIKDN